MHICCNPESESYEYLPYFLCFTVTACCPSNSIVLDIKHKQMFSHYVSCSVRTSMNQDDIVGGTSRNNNKLMSLQNKYGRAWTLAKASDPAYTLTILQL
jgi:hypothetical protein